MDSHTQSAQVRRLEVVETGRRRRWTEDEKVRIVAESLSGPGLTAVTARRYGISPGLLYSWRRTFRGRPIGQEDGAPSFVSDVERPADRYRDIAASPAGEPIRARQDA